jgi:hypothetical protein
VDVHEIIAAAVSLNTHQWSIEMKKTTTPPEKPMSLHRFLVGGAFPAAEAMQSWGSKYASHVDLLELVGELNARIKAVHAGEMKPIEAMLYGQAMTLQTIFTKLIASAASETGLNQFQVKMSLGLKAQAQCRATLEALAEIKNPRSVSFVKQANISNGPQQVNNGFVTSRTENFESEPNKLLETQHGDYLDTTAQGTTGRINPNLETVG